MYVECAWYLDIRDTRHQPVTSKWHREARTRFQIHWSTLITSKYRLTGTFFSLSPSLSLSLSLSLYLSLSLSLSAPLYFLYFLFFFSELFFLFLLPSFLFIHLSLCSRRKFRKIFENTRYSKSSVVSPLYARHPYTCTRVSSSSIRCTRISDRRFALFSPVWRVFSTACFDEPRTNSTRDNVDGMLSSQSWHYVGCEMTISFFLNSMFLNFLK